MNVSEVGWERETNGTSVRVLRDSDSGRKWRVWQADTSHLPGARAVTCLIFDTGDLVRRVWRVPDDWAQLPPTALLTLAEVCLRDDQAEVIRPDRPPSSRVPQDSLRSNGDGFHAAPSRQRRA